MDEDGLTLYIILFFVAFISGLALLAARSQRRRQNAYEPWHARLAAAKGKPGHDGNIVSKTSTGWVSGVLLSVVALAAIVAWAIFFWSSSSVPKLVPRCEISRRPSSRQRAGQRQSTIAMQPRTNWLMTTRRLLNNLRPRHKWLATMQAPPKSLRRTVNIRPVFSLRILKRACGPRLPLLGHLRSLLSRSAGRSS